MCTSKNCMKKQVMTNVERDLRTAGSFLANDRIIYLEELKIRICEKQAIFYSVMGFNLYWLIFGELYIKLYYIFTTIPGNDVSNDKGKKIQGFYVFLLCY